MSPDPGPPLPPPPPISPTPPPGAPYPPPPPKSNGTKIALIIIASVLGVFLLLSCLFAALLIPALGKARDTAREIRTMSQLRLIGTALMAYSQEWRDRYPPHDTWEDTLIQGNYLSPSDLTIRDAPPGHPVFLYFPGDGRAGFSSTDVIVAQNPATVRGRRGAVLYEDGHVAAVPLADLEALIANLSAQQAP